VCFVFYFTSALWAFSAISGASDVVYKLFLPSTGKLTVSMWKTVLSNKQNKFKQHKRNKKMMKLGLVRNDNQPTQQNP